VRFRRHTTAGDTALPSWPLALSCVSFPFSLHTIPFSTIKVMVLFDDCFLLHFHSRHAERPPATMYYASPHGCGRGPFSPWLIIDLTLPAAHVCDHSTNTYVGLATTRRRTLRHFSRHSPCPPHQALTLHLYRQFLSLFHLALWARPLYPAHARSHLTPNIPHVHLTRYEISACSIVIPAEPSRPVFTPVSPHTQANRPSHLLTSHVSLIHTSPPRTFGPHYRSSQGKTWDTNQPLSSPTDVASSPTGRGTPAPELYYGRQATQTDRRGIGTVPHHADSHARPQPTVPPPCALRHQTSDPNVSPAPPTSFHLDPHRITTLLTCLRAAHPPHSTTSSLHFLHIHERSGALSATDAGPPRYQPDIIFH